MMLLGFGVSAVDTRLYFEKCCGVFSEHRPGSIHFNASCINRLMASNKAATPSSSGRTTGIAKRAVSFSCSALARKVFAILQKSSI